MLIAEAQKRIGEVAEMIVVSNCGVERVC